MNYENEVVSGMHETIERIYRDHAGLVRARALSILRDRQAAEDITQDVFVNFIRYQDGTRQVLDVAGFLFRSTTNLALNHLRNRKRRREDGLHESEPAGCEEKIELIENRSLLDAVLAEVDEELARLALYFYLDGMQHQEIADLLGMQRRTVGRRLEQFLEEARAALRKRGVKSI